MRNRTRPTSNKQFLLSAHTICISFLTPALILSTGCMSIHTAARAGNLAEVKRQLTWGVNPNSRTFWYLDTPLHMAAAYGNVRVVELLIEKGADVTQDNEGGETPLHYASKHGHTKVMKILLEHGADVSYKGTGCGTPLQWAARNGQIKAAELLLAHGAYINQQGTSDRTALIDAASYGHVDMVRLLLSRGATVNIRASYDYTALHAAASSNNLEIGRILIEHGADPTIKYNGRTVLEKARSDEFRKLIRQHDKTEIP